ncbi:TetR/AcrR family transcriptional regulator [Gordonia sp. TBRC 11910]|uniref:TetR/AcrR family transcriptional regulator n=1 Tax=Gordonia asplenii TaxID=2725283 RepID=A0A848KWG7_9ACTN|nr:TetR/AcrR family transcriptional regulator [Gordonia asplenii]NMO01215.1 TetR/AcrR family transcriptional regulator [Gordonia asplenii]
MAYHHGNLRSAILIRAEEVLTTNGVDAITLRSLARDLAVSHSAPSKHFADRNALLDALAADGFERLNHELTTTAAGNDTFDRRLHATAHAYMHFAGTHPRLLALMYARKHTAAESVVQAAADSCARTLLTLLTDGDAPVDDPERFGIIMLACLQGIAGLAAGDGLPPGYDADALATDAVERLVRGSESGRQQTSR